MGGEVEFKGGEVGRRRKRERREGERGEKNNNNEEMRLEGFNSVRVSLSVAGACLLAVWPVWPVWLSRVDGDWARLWGVSEQPQEREGRGRPVPFVQSIRTESHWTLSSESLPGVQYNVQYRRGMGEGGRGKGEYGKPGGMMG